MTDKNYIPISDDSKSNVDYEKPFHNEFDQISLENPLDTTNIEDCHPKVFLEKTIDNSTIQELQHEVSFEKPINTKTIEECDHEVFLEKVHDKISLEKPFDNIWLDIYAHKIVKNNDFDKTQSFTVININDIDYDYPKKSNSNYGCCCFQYCCNSSNCSNTNCYFYQSTELNFCYFTQIISDIFNLFEICCCQECSCDCCQ